MSYTEARKQILQNLRSNLISERRVYSRAKSTFERDCPKEWLIVSEAIKAIAVYYHGEIVRLKHDIAHFINGHDEEGELDYGACAHVPKLHTLIQELAPLLKIASKSSDNYNILTGSTLQTATAKVTLERDQQNLQEKLEQIKQIKKTVEDQSYGERRI